MVIKSVNREYELSTKRKEQAQSSKLERLLDPLSSLRANSINHIKSVARHERFELFQRGYFELLMQQRRRLWPDAWYLGEVENRFRRLGDQSIPRIEGASFQQFDHFPGDRLANAGDLLQSGDSLFFRDLLQWCRPHFDRFRRITIGA